MGYGTGYIKSIEIEKPHKTKTNIFTHDWTKKETWYTTSQKIENIECINLDNKNFVVPNTLAYIEEWQANTSYNIGDKVKPNVGNGFIYECTHDGISGVNNPNWLLLKNLEFTDNSVTWKVVEPTQIVNVSDGLLSNEVYLRSTYQPIISVNNEFVQENSIFSRNLYQQSNFDENSKKKYLDGNYSINYKQGIVTFNNELNENDIVKITYNKVIDSKFIISPTLGKILEIDDVKALFSDDIRILDDIIFTVYFQGQPLPSLYYESFYNFCEEISMARNSINKTKLYENEVFSVKDLESDLNNFVWGYKTVTNLYSNLDMFLEIKLLHDYPLQGKKATATLFCTITDL